MNSLKGCGMAVLVVLAVVGALAIIVFVTCTASLRQQSWH
jgi:hypothetical protein